jgi:hypothetical protein
VSHDGSQDDRGGENSSKPDAKTGMAAIMAAIPADTG